MFDEYQIKLAASKPEVPVNFLVEIILGVPTEILEKVRPDYDPNNSWRAGASLLPGAGRVGFPSSVSDEQFPPNRLGLREWLITGAYIFLTECIVLKFNLKESELLLNKVPTHEFAQWVENDKILDRLKDMEVNVHKQAVTFINMVLKNGRLQIKSKSNRHLESEKHREDVRDISKKLWENDDSSTIQDIICSDEVNSIKKPDGTNYSETTLRKWIKDLAPSNKPGRRPSKK
jgi:hypothetical protein